MNYKHHNTIFSSVHNFIKKLWGFHGGLIRPNDNIIFRSAFYTISPEGIEPHRCVCLKKWPGRLVTLQHLVLFRDTLIYFSYYRILNLLTSQRNRTFSEQSRPLLYHAMRTSTCQKQFDVGLRECLTDIITTYSTISCIDQPTHSPRHWYLQLSTLSSASWACWHRINL